MTWAVWRAINTADEPVADNDAALRAELAELRAELAELRAELAELRPGSLTG